MLSLLVNNTHRVNLIFDSLSFNFSIDINQQCTSAFEGVLELPFNIKCNNDIFDIKFYIDNNYITLTDTSIDITISDNMIIIKYENLLYMYDKILRFMNKELRNPFRSALVCLNTQLTCNLSCKYCSMGCYNQNKIFIPPYDASFYLYNDIQDIIFKNHYSQPNNIRYRIMGGETFLYPSIFKQTYSNLLKLSKNRNGNILYLYTNLLVNLDHVIHFVNQATQDGFKVILIASLDSFNLKISERFNHINDIIKFKQNIFYINKLFSHNPNVIFTVSVLSTGNIRDIKKTFNILFRYGITDIKFNFNEFKLSKKDLRRRHQIIKKIVHSRFYKKFSTSKLMVEDFLITNFNISANGLNIGSIRTVNRLGIGNNIHILYKDHSLLRTFFKKESVTY